LQEADITAFNDGNSAQRVHLENERPVMSLTTQLVINSRLIMSQQLFGTVSDGQCSYLLTIYHVMNSIQN